MKERRRLEQLHEMLERLERMPASRDRDFMLREVRARIVDVESGETPEPVRVQAPESEVAEAAAPKPVPKPARPVPPPRPAPVQVGTANLKLAPAAPRRATHDSVDLLLQGGHLSLDDEPGDVDGAPWARGLRA